MPIAQTAAPGSTLIKVVPKGDSVGPFSAYWMTPSQAEEIAAMSPVNVGAALGLPASQAAKIFGNGMDFYAIAARPGSGSQVYVSDIASTTQGAITTSPSAQQVIVANRSAWTPAVQIDPKILTGLR